MSRVLNVTVLWGLSQAIKEVASRKVFVCDFQHILCQRLGSALVHSEIRDLKGDEQRDDVNRHSNVVDVGDPVGGVESEGVVHIVRLHLHVLDVPVVNVILGKRLDRGLFGSDVALFRFNKTPEKAMRWGYLDCKHNLRWQVVLVGDLPQSEKIQLLNLKCHMHH